MVLFRICGFGGTRFLYAQIQCLAQMHSEQSDNNGSTQFQNGDAKNLIFELGPDGDGERKYSMKKNWNLHLYISQLPCNFLFISKENKCTFYFFLLFLL